MVTGLEVDSLRVARAQVEVLADLVKVVKDLVVEIKKLNDRQESLVKY